jgi:hypothetical protein
VPVKYLTRLLASVLAAAAVVAGLSACGGGSDEDALALLRKSFAQPIGSANVTIDVTVKVDGVPQLSKPIRVKAGGPYQSNGSRKLPSLDWDLSVSGGGQTFSAGVVTTGDNAFINFQGTNYEVGEAAVAKYNQQLAQRQPKGKQLKAFGIDPVNWVKDASMEDDSTVAGVQTQHVSAGVDVEKFFNDINKLVNKAGASGVPGTAATAQLTKDQIDQVKKVIKDPKFDAYVGKSDDKLRRVAVSMDFDVPDEAQSSARGIKGGNVSVSVEFAAVGEPQKITAPTGAKPLSDLTKQLGGLGSLGGALGGAGAGGLGGSSGGATPGGAAGGSGSSPNSEQYKKYADCLNKAKPSDVAAIQHCAQLLK